MATEKRILVVGMNCLDLVHTCKNLPTRTQKDWHDTGHWQRGGNASNACTVIKNLGGNVEYLGTLSDSQGFTAVTQDFKNHNIIIENCPRTKLTPAFSSILFNEIKGLRTIIVCLNADYPYVKFESFKKLNLKNYKWIHWEGRYIGETLQMINFTKKFNDENPDDKIMLSVELDHPDLNLLQLAENINYVVCSKNYAQFCEFTTGPEAVKGLREKINNKNCTIVVPWSSQGTTTLAPDNKMEIVDIYEPTKIVDTLGAGDAFIGAMILSLSQGNSTSIAVSYGNKVAGYKLQTFGYENIKDLVSCAMECCVPTCDCCQSCSK